MLKELKRGLSAVISAALLSAVCVLPVSADGLPSDGLVMHSTFDEANVTSSSFEAIVGGTVTKKGNVTYTKSYDNSDGNKAMSIASNTAGNYLELPKGILSGADEAAFAFWIKPTSGWAFMTTPLEQQEFLREKYLGMLAIPAAFTAERYNNSGTRLSSVTANGDFDDWQYIITEFTQNGTKVYVNGKLKSSDTAAVDIKSLMTADASTWIGHGNWGSGEGFSGKIDDFRVYSRTLSDDEIAALSADARQLEIEKAVAERNCIDAETQFYNGQDKVFQARPGESVTVKTKITNNKAYPKKLRYHIECDNDAAESVCSEELTLDVLEEKEITAEINNAEEGV